MNFENQIKYFSAVAYDGSTYNFCITPTGEILCMEFGINLPANLIEIKPNFVLRGTDGRTVYTLDDYLREETGKKNDGLSLISEWIISEDILEYLINNKKITYSTQVAILYGLDKSSSFDLKHNRRAFKHNPYTRKRIPPKFN